jgi:hypothetical protein
MKSTDGSIIEIFEAHSQKAIEEANYNKEILDLWMRTGKVCEFTKPTDVPEFHTVFSTFEVIDFQEHN